MTRLAQTTLTSTCCTATTRRCPQASSWTCSTSTRPRAASGAFGVSNWTIARFEEANEYAAKHGRAGFAVLSNNLSLARMIEPPWEGCVSASDRESRRWLEARQIPLLSWSSQAQGFFGPTQFPASWLSDDNHERRERARTLAKEKGIEPTTIALAYVLAQPFPRVPGHRPRHDARDRVVAGGARRGPISQRGRLAKPGTVTAPACV